MSQRRYKLSKIIMSLALAGLFSLSLFLIGLPRPASVVYAAGETCFATINGSTVYSSTDAAAVQTAIDNADPNDVIKIAGTCVGVTQTAGISQTAYISQNLTLQGGYTTTWTVSDPEANPTVLDAQSLGRVVYISSGITVTLDSLTIQNGFSTDNGGGVYDSDGSLTLLNSTVQHNEGNQGGGIYDQGGLLTITDSKVQYNQSDTPGGGLYKKANGELSVAGTLIFSNTGTYGGGIENYAMATITNSQIISNTATGGGGGIAHNPKQPLTISNSLIRGNVAQKWGGGGLYVDDAAPVTIISSTIEYNQAQMGGGGGIRSSSAGTLTIISTTLQYNQAETNNGGGLYYTGDSTVHLHDSLVAHNQASDDGGGLYAMAGDGSTVISNTRLISNTAKSGGGFYAAHPITITNSAINQNVANTLIGGGGLLEETPYFLIQNSDIISNTSVNGGGGLDVYVDSHGQILDTRILSNTSANGGGGIFMEDSATLTVTNSELAYNLSTNRGGGGIYVYNFSDLSLQNSRVHHNTSVGKGGGVYAEDHVRLMVVDSELSYNTSTTTSEGGGLYLLEAQAQVQNSTISHNQANIGGGLYLANGAILTATNSIIEQNEAGTQGGGLYLANGATLTATTSTIEQNEAVTNGGGLYIAGSNTQVLLDETTVYSNTSVNQGGGLYLRNGAILTATTSTIEQNEAGTQGGGLYVIGGNAQVHLSETTVESNSAATDGGGLYARDTSITVLGGQVISNTSGDGGGGMFQDNGGTSVFSGTQISHNRTVYGGGGLKVNSNAGYVLTNTVLSDNHATSGDGGAMLIVNTSSASLVDSTVFSNTAGHDGGGLFNDLGSTMHLTNTIVSHNQAVARGGGIRNDKALTLHNSQIISNSVTSDTGNGGGLYLGNSAIVTQTGVLTLAYNQASRNGGGIYVNKGLLSLDGARILDNYADSDGGGVYVNAGQVQIDGARILNNGSDGNGGGAIYQAGSTTGITVTNSCLVFNDNTAVYHNGGPTLSATGNWWGANDGPSGAGPGHGDAINHATNIDASGFLTTAPAGCPGYTPILTLSGGDNQATEIDQTFSQPLSVTLTMAENSLPFSSEVITFTGPSSGAGINPAVVTATTDVDGLAVVTPTANSDWGDYQIIASSDLVTDPVTFTLQNYARYTLTMATAGNGNGTVTPGGVYTNSPVATITASANTGSYFTGWSGDATGTTNPLTVTMTSDKSITATFTLDTTPPTTSTLISPANGSVITTTQTPTFDWPDADDGETSVISYTLLITTSNDSLTIQQASDTVTTTLSEFTPSAPLDYGVYTWTVKAHDAAGNVSGYASPPFVFTLKATGSKLYLPIVVK